MSTSTPKSEDTKTSTPYRQIRALYDEKTITVYQAYSKEIAEAAVREQRLDASPAFRCERMTWIKPSWCWMMYRSGYTTKDPRQTNILALTLTHTTFLTLLSRATVCKSNHGPLTASERSKPVRVQWDPERGPALEILPYRSLQVGIGKEVVREWVEGGGIVKIEDVSERARDLGRWAEGRERAGEGEWEELVEKGLVPRERVFDVPEEIRVGLEMS
ncbi:hypothetical protein ONS95_010988 [Cadophora gregata]|uniref:uncharacterized protein n=1 Tax=Cadophora gregata TaxID=51156 RepID=UPI0026DD3127|nr:uncharacterized protein ONS95_010988 [Cadophora gregata]KAK0119548.1 hypothetical protein ONS95_010988 [Cadophora gregata]KAK0120586.1 hypothetical protein ONS96_010790 [Cadophora gregata f. sp. sojae]